MSVLFFHNPCLVALDYYLGVTCWCFFALPKCNALRFEMVFVQLIGDGNFARANHSRYILIADWWRFHYFGQIRSQRWLSG